MEKTPAEPRLSATILMVRDAASGPPEVLMVKRHYEIDFAAGALVFPGGKASADDSRADWDAYTDGDYGPPQRAGPGRRWWARTLPTSLRHTGTP